MVWREYVPPTHSEVARQVNSAAAGASRNASRAPSRASLLTPLSAERVLLSVMVIGYSTFWDWLRRPVLSTLFEAVATRNLRCLPA